MSYIYIHTYELATTKNYPIQPPFPMISHFFASNPGSFPFLRGTSLSFVAAVAAVAAVNVGRQLQPARLATFGRQARHAADAARQLGQLDVLPR